MNEDVDRRKQILEAAKARYEKADPASVSMRQIAKDAGVSVALVYHYFEDKDALYHACLDDLYEELRHLAEEGQATVAAGGSVEDALETLVRGGFAFACAQRPWVLMIQRAVTERGGLDQARREGFQKPFLDSAAQLLSSATGRSVPDARLAIQTVQLLIVRYSLSHDDERRAFVGEDVADPTQAIEDHLVDVTFRLLLGRPKA